jgi:hypothetical protein
MQLPLSNFAGFQQIAYVTTDLAWAIRYFANDHGVARWAELPDMQVETMPERSCCVHVALCWVSDLQLELIQPLGGDDSVYRAPLPTDGFALRLHHLAQLIHTEADYEAQRQALRVHGAPIVFDGHRPGTARYFYTDHRQTLGHYIEHVWYTPAGMESMLGLPRN